MKSIRVLVVLLLVSVHVSTQESTSQPSPEKTSKSSDPGITAKVTTPIATTTTAAAAATTAAATTATTAAASTAAAATTASSATAPSSHVTSKSTNLPPRGLPTENVSLSSARNPSVTPTSMNKTSKENDTTLIPKSGRGTPAPGPQNTTVHHITSSKTTLNSKESPSGSDAGHQTSDKKEGADKRWWWIVLPALLIAAAVGIVLKFKSKKLHDPTETIDTGTENASFQRAENSKDGVMLLGVKSSGGEENDPAR